MKSIKTFLLSWILGIIAMAVLAIGVVSYNDAQHEIEELFDAELAKTAKMVMHLMAAENDQRTSGKQNSNIMANLDSSSNEANISHKYEHKIAYQIFDRGLNLVTESANAPDFKPKTSEIGFLSKTIKSETWHLFVIYNVHKQQWLVTAQHGDIREELVADILRHLLTPFIIGTPILILLVWFFLGKGLKPLLLLANSIARREPQHLEALQLKAVPVEIKPIVESLNQLFVRLADTMEREKRFTADAAHELRTPLSILKIHAQNAAVAETFDESKQSLSQLLLGVDKSTHLVEQLLKLARLEPRQNNRSSFEAVNFSQLLKEEYAQQFPLSLKNQQQLDICLPDEDIILQGDSLVLSLMLRNVIDNSLLPLWRYD